MCKITVPNGAFGISNLRRSRCGKRRGKERRTEMWEDLYQVYRRYGDNQFDLRASNMTLADALLFIKAVFEESYNETDLRFEIRRQLMEDSDAE